MAGQSAAFKPNPSEPGDGLRLFLLGFLTLFLELLLIRYLAGNIWNLGFFPNLVLLGAFVGMGTGFVSHHLISERSSVRIFDFFPLVLLTLVIFVQVLHPQVPGFGATEGQVGGEVFFSSTNEATTGTNYFLFALWLASIILIFAMISQRTAKLFARFAPLRAYTLDIAGSCTGIVTFSLLSWGHSPAGAWFLVCIPLSLFARSVASRAGGVLMAAALVVASASAFYQDTTLLWDSKVDQDLVVRWSPYQKVETVKTKEGASFLFVNGITHQAMHPAEQIGDLFYQAPYNHRAKRFPDNPFKRVLIIGAGSGNDAVAALRNGATHVDAIEIDPVIAESGRLLHPARPYDDPRVHVTVGDGRAFLTGSRERYDLIIFALTDSLVKVSPMAQLRLENYVFTREAIARAYQLLNPTGSIALYNYYRQPFVVAKLEKAIFEATGTSTTRLSGWNGLDVVLVDKVPEGTAPAPAPAGIEGVETAVDDWPFPYLRTKSVPGVYMVALAFVVFYVLAVLLVVRWRSAASSTLNHGGGSIPHKLAFALMGMAFLLLETKSIIQFSLLFGTTWFNNSMVFLAILLSVLAANRIAELVEGDWLFWLTFPLLLISSLLPLVFPLSDLLYVDNGLARFLAASALTFSPVFFANLLFSLAFRDEATPEHVFGWNLFGSTLGGVMEYSSMLLGYDNLAIVVAVCYAVSFLLLTIGRTPVTVAALTACFLAYGGSSLADEYSDVEVSSEAVRDGIYVLTGKGGNVAVSIGNDGVVLVDDQYAPLTDKILAELAKLTTQPVRFVINTHWHGDHTGGNENLGKTGAVVLAHDNVRARMSTQQHIPVFGGPTPAAPLGALPIMTFGKHVSLHVNGLDIQTRHVSAAHTDGDSMVHFAGADVLHTGDVFSNGFYPFIDIWSGGTIDGMIAATDEALALAGPDTVIIPGHGPMADRSELEAYRDMLVTARNAVRNRKQAGDTEVEMAKLGVLAQLDPEWGDGPFNADLFSRLVYRSLADDQS